MKLVVGLFGNNREADRAVKALKEAGFRDDDFNLLVQNNVVKKEAVDEDVSAAEGAGIGAVEGGVIGGVAGLLAGIGALAIPGLGPVLATGALASTLAGAGVGAVAGAATGGIVAALVDMGVPEEDAHVYAEGVRQGGVLVTVNASTSRADEAVGIMRQAGAIDVNEQRESWTQEGWRAFDPSAKPAIDLTR